MIKKLVVGDMVIGTYASGFLLERHSGFGMASIRVDMKDRGHYHGANLGNVYYGRRALSIEGEIVGLDVADYEEKRRVLSGSFDIMRGEQVLQIETHDGKVYIVDVIVQNAVETPYEKGKMVRGKFQLSLVSSSPFFKDIFEDDIDIFMYDGGGFAVPFAIPFAMAQCGSTNETLENNGNTPAYPIITVYGVCTNPTISNGLNGQSISYTGTLGAGEYIEIDIFNRIAMLNGVTNVIDDVSGDWLQIESGSNNIVFSATGADEDARVNFKWNDTYIGI